MGLQGQLSDVSSDSIPLLMVALIGTAVGHLRSLIFSVIQCLGLAVSSQEDTDVCDDDGGGLLSFLGSGLGGLILITNKHHHRTRLLSSSNEDDCAVCLSGLMEGDSVSSLPCRHVFHKHCFDAWVDRLNFTCPLCRSSVVPDERVRITGRRLGSDMVAWFSTIH